MVIWTGLGWPGIETGGKPVRFSRRILHHGVSKKEHIYIYIHVYFLGYRGKEKEIKRLSSEWGKESRSGSNQSSLFF